MFPFGELVKKEHHDSLPKYLRLYVNLYLSQNKKLKKIKSPTKFNMFLLLQHTKCNVLLNEDHTTCGKERFIGTRPQGCHSFGFRVQWFG
jgi:hypothetical protein